MWSLFLRLRQLGAFCHISHHFQLFIVFNLFCVWVIFLWVFFVFYLIAMLCLELNCFWRRWLMYRPDVAQCVCDIVGPLRMAAMRAVGDGRWPWVRIVFQLTVCLGNTVPTICPRGDSDWCLHSGPNMSTLFVTCIESVFSLFLTATAAH